METYAVKLHSCDKHRGTHLLSRLVSIDEATAVADQINATKECPMHGAPIRKEATVVEFGQAIGSDRI